MHDTPEEDDLGTRLYRRFMDPLLATGRLPLGISWPWRHLLLLASLRHGPFGLVIVKMLPFDNKSEFQVIVDMPEGTTLEQTAAATQDMAAISGRFRRSRTTRSTSARPSPSTSTGWCAITTCGAGRMLRISR